MDPFHDLLPEMITEILDASTIPDVLRFRQTCKYHSTYYDVLWKHPDVRKCMTYFEQVFTDKDVMHDTLKYFASFLDNKGNTKQIFGVFAGAYSNSKSTMTKLIQLTFGNEAANILNYFTFYRKVSEDTKVVIMEKYNTIMDIEDSTIRRLAGGDSYYNEDEDEIITPKFKLIGSCNDVSLLGSRHKSIRMRIKIIPFSSMWVDDAPESIIEQYAQRRFLKDVYFNDRVGDMAVAFRWILKMYLKIYEVEGLCKHYVDT